MKSLNTSIPDNIRWRVSGFTIIEIIIVIALLAGFALAGIVAGIDIYQRYIFRLDIDNLVGLLQKARSSAMSNIGGVSHGVYVCDPSKFILFRGASYGALPAYNFNVSKSSAVIITSCSGPDKIVFAPLSGTTAGGIITASDGIRSTAITVNNEGRINW